jgi:hypothetical protein
MASVSLTVYYAYLKTGIPKCKSVSHFRLMGRMKSFNDLNDKSTWQKNWNCYYSTSTEFDLAKHFKIWLLGHEMAHLNKVIIMG